MYKIRPLFEQLILNRLVIIFMIFLFVILFDSLSIAVAENTSKDWLNKSIDFYIDENYDLALLAINKSIELDQNDKISMNNKGVILNKLGRYDEALDIFDKSIIIDPFDSNSWYNKGITQEKLSQTKEALESYTTATKLNPRYEDAWNRKGIVLRELGQYPEAIHAYDKIIELHPGSVSAWINKGIALSYSGQSNEALNCFYKVIEMNPENREDLAKAWMYVGIDCLLENRPEEAVGSFEHTIEIGGGYDWIWTAWFCKGIAFKSMGRDSDSRHALDTSKKIRVKGNLWDSLTYAVREYLNRTKDHLASLVLVDQHQLLLIGA